MTAPTSLALIQLENIPSVSTKVEMPPRVELSPAPAITTRSPPSCCQHDSEASDIHDIASCVAVTTANSGFRKSSRRLTPPSAARTCGCTNSPPASFASDAIRPDARSGMNFCRMVSAVPDFNSARNRASRATAASRSSSPMILPNSLALATTARTCGLR